MVDDTMVLTRLTVVLERLEELIRDHENRIRALEKWAYAVPITALMAMVSLTIGMLR